MHSKHAVISQPLASEGTTQPASVMEASTSQAADADKALDAMDGDGFVLVDKHDAVECLAFYIAACIQDLPEAQQMTPRQLQLALVEALRVGGCRPCGSRDASAHGFNWYLKACKVTAAVFGMQGRASVTTA